MIHHFWPIKKKGTAWCQVLMPSELPVLLSPRDGLQDAIHALPVASSILAAAADTPSQECKPCALVGILLEVILLRVAP